jgi:CheY-like chemotaxis protein
MNNLKKVLVVDDDPVISHSFNRVLAGKGYVVVSAENGQEALKKIANEEYDAVFTDIRMPGEDGIEVARQVRAERPWMPVVIITGYGSPENEARAEAVGVKGFLRKPLSPKMIEESVAEVTADPQVSVHAPAEADVKDEKPARRGIGTILKDIALFLAAPFIGLAYVALFPFIGLAMLAWMGAKALRKQAA